ncbi:aldehyde dehydrogenase family protein [Ornithinimicrobium sp. Arc0846-15]|nr:aldehyde dehydrogenase family protein [Ornithinimicrobium laminariae]
MAAGEVSELLGGAGPVIIDDTANIDNTVNILVRRVLYHAGQVYVSAQRLFVHEDIADEFTTRFVDSVRELKAGDPVDPTTEVGPLIRLSAVERVADITEPGHDVHLGTEEIFGPVAAIYRYSDLEEAIGHANLPNLYFHVRDMSIEGMVVYRSASL